MTDTTRTSAALLTLFAACSDAGPPAPLAEGSTAIAGDTSSSDALASSSSPDDDGDTHGSDSSDTGEAPTPSGEELWRTTINAGRAMAVAATPDGGAIVVGSDDLIEGRGLAIKIDDAGMVQWKHVVEYTEGHAALTDVAIGRDDAAWVVGYRALPSSLSRTRGIVMERLDLATGEISWAEPAAMLDPLVPTSADLFAVAAYDGGVVVAGQLADEDNLIRPLVRVYLDDGSLLFEANAAIEGRLHDLAIVDDTVYAVGARFASSNDDEPLGAFASAITLDAYSVPTPELPPGPAYLSLAVPHPELGCAMLGEYFTKDDHGFDVTRGWMLATAGDGDVIDLPHGIGGAAVDADGVIVTVHDGDVEAFDAAGVSLWSVKDTVAASVSYADGLAITADGELFVVGGFDGMEIAKIAPPA